MAKQREEKKSQNITNTGVNNIDTRVFAKGMMKDQNPTYTEEAVWGHARNAVINSSEGDLVAVGNEPANYKCADIPYTVIGAIHRYGDEWIIFSTDDVSSEIGLFDDSKCEYTTLVNAPCLNFNRKHLITGAAKENFDCSWQVYWDDGFNPSRTLNLDQIPYKKIIASTAGSDCLVYDDTNELDCEKLRLAPLLKTPCVKLSKSKSGGQLRNGTYQAYIAYTLNEQRVTDYIGISNPQSLFDHDDTKGSLEITLSDLDENFEHFELVLLIQTAQSTEAQRVGIYSTQSESINIDYLDPALINVPIQQLPIVTPAYEKSDAMFVVNDYLIRKSPREKFDFNYQPLANNIRAKWVVAEYDPEYYYNGGNKPSFMRDEQYAFFIRWIYNTGDKSKSYHIPGRPPREMGVNQFGEIINELALNLGPDSIDPDDRNFKIYNTATLSQSNLNIPTDDGGTIIAKGDMGYWQSTEKYPDNKFDIWGNLCGKNIRHHKMPTEETHPSLKIYDPTSNKIRILGVEFENIAFPVDNDGNPIDGIVGYEILRGSRFGNRSILAKGVLRNMRVYDIPDGSEELGLTKGLYPNYPYNDLSPDIYFHKGKSPEDSIEENRTDGCDTFSQSINQYAPLDEYRKDVFTFHSPELMFKQPFLNAQNLRVYGELHGESIGHFIPSENHPRYKLLRNSAAVVASIVGIGYAIKQVRGTYERRLENAYAGEGGGGGGVVGTGINLILGAVAGGLVRSFTFNILDGVSNIASLYSGNIIGDLILDAQDALESGYGSIPGVVGGRSIRSYTADTPDSQLPNAIAALAGLVLAQKNLAIGAQEVIDLLYNLVSESDFAFKYNSKASIFDYVKRNKDSVYRTRIRSARYLNSSYQQFDNYKVNNLFRPGTVAVSTQKELDDPILEDTSRFVIGGRVSKNGLVFSNGNKYLKEPQLNRKSKVSMLYGALKFEMDNQYGQIPGIKQVQMRGCVYPAVLGQNKNKKFKTDPIFSGDVYINRYTEKVIMPIFSDFLKDQPDQYPYDYLMRINIPYPRYWMNTYKYDTSALAREIVTFGFAANDPETLPNDLFYLDRGSTSCFGGRVLGRLLGGNGDPNPGFAMRYAYMYTHVNGILDFYVESEYNLAQRDWLDQPELRHYDPYHGYENVDDLLHADIIKFGNFYKYDESLSVSRLINQNLNFGSVQDTTYDPEVAEECYQNYPKRLIYSLPANLESKKDFWRVFLANNYKDFRSPVTTIEQINQSGALILFPYQSPQMFQGVDQLQTDLGTKLTIGDGGLFSTPMQNVTNSNVSNEYGSAESARAIINTPYGVFMMSQAQGKIFQYSSGLAPISDMGMKFWFNKYLPSVLIEQYPELEFSKLSDNPVIGIGCQVIYDITNEIVYFGKKDFKVKDQYVNNIYFENDSFYYSVTKQGGYKIKIGDPRYFDDASWVISYDPKIKAWVSFHDWSPELMLPSIKTFLTTKTNTSQNPICPPGYNYNSNTGKCESISQATSLAVVTVETEPTVVVGGNCTCPPGYTVVYRDSNNYFTLPSGDCLTLGDDGLPPYTVNAVCRKVTCECPDPPFEGGVTTESGNCDDVYAIGNPNYINNQPKNCFYFKSNQVSPNYDPGSIWRHNDRCDLFSNYYDVDYPWEVESIHATAQSVNTLRSVEYQLESYVYRNTGVGRCSDDRWHDLDFNFDEAIIYNSEQISGLLKLDLKPKNDPFGMLDYPIFNINEIRVLYSKEEQKFRFNQFWDITRDRGEFTGVQNFNFNTQINGYIRDLNITNLNYQKPKFELKKFRHYYNKLILRRTVSGNRKMILKISNVKLNLSLR